jgi:serine/threonine protein kinase
MQDSEHWQELQALFDLADTAIPEERERVLIQAGAKPEIRRRVLALLQSAEQEPATDPPRPPIGPYTILELIGSGGVGSVYLAEHALDGVVQRVALKVLAPHAAGPGFVERFARERRILASLENPGITRLLDAGLSADGHPFMVMEYVEGVHLDDYCNANRLDLRARLLLFQKVCAVVDYAHSSSVVHLDLKPSNILVTSEGNTKLLDFGTAKLLSSDGTFTATVMATPAYASPEQLRYEPVTTASDVYSLGVILFELLIGRRPSRESKPLTAGERLSSIRSVELSAILAKCLAEAPQERYPAVKALSEDVARFLACRPVRVNDCQCE